MPILNGLELLTNPKALRLRNEDVIASLYDPQQYQCFTCGLRLEKVHVNVAEHLDVHFAEMQLKRKQEEDTFCPSRSWFSTASTWTNICDQKDKCSEPETDTPDELRRPTMLSDVVVAPFEILICNPDDVDTCVGCGDSLSSEWQDEEDEWIYIGDCQRLSEDRVTHKTCMDDAKRNMQLRTI
jgi:hypothetical protein